MKSSASEAPSLSQSPRLCLAGSVLCSREGRASRAEGPTASPGMLPCRNLCHCGSARPRLSEAMPSPRRVIESCTRTILPVAVVAAVAALEAAKLSTLHESRCSLRPELAGGALRGGCPRTHMLVWRVGSDYRNPKL